MTQPSLAKPAAEDVLNLLRGQIYSIGTTAPIYAEEGWLWADTSTNPPTVLRYTDGAWISIFADYVAGRELVVDSAGGSATTPIGNTVSLSSFTIPATAHIEILYGFLRTGAGNITLGIGINGTVVDDTILSAVAAHNGLVRIWIPRRDRGYQTQGATQRHGTTHVNYGASGVLTTNRCIGLGATASVPMNVDITALTLRAAASSGSVELRSVQVFKWVPA